RHRSAASHTTDALGLREDGTDVRLLSRRRLRRRPEATLFPYTTLFRSIGSGGLDNTLSRPPQSSRPISSLQCRSSAGSIVLVNRSEEHTSELQSRENIVCRLLLEKKKSYGRTTQRRSTPK